MVATYAHVDVSNEFPTVGDGDAPLQDSGHGALVQLIINHGERLSFAGDAPGLGPIRGEFPLIDLGKVLGPPVLHAGVLSVRNMVPTLTSSKRRGLSLNGRC
jgi:hypothetical protein